MRFFIILLLLACAMSSCNNQESAQKEIKPTANIKFSCYVYAWNNDTVSLQLKDSNAIITGTLNYLPYEKDGTIGELYDMKVFGDTLFGTYKSFQEGIETIGEMALLKKGDTYILTNDNWGGDNYKYDTANTNGKFVDKSKITFTGDTLKLVTCK
jgi:hypothetical protein